MQQRVYRLPVCYDAVECAPVESHAAACIALSVLLYLYCSICIAISVQQFSADSVAMLWQCSQFSGFSGDAVSIPESFMGMGLNASSNNCRSSSGSILPAKQKSTCASNKYEWSTVNLLCHCICKTFVEGVNIADLSCQWVT